MEQIHWRWLIPLFSYAFSCCSQTIPTNYHKALEAAKRSLPNQSIPIIKDELVYLRQLSLKPNIEDSFHTVNVCRLVDRMHLWNKYLPHVNIYYAVKTNHADVVTRVLAALGNGFDCASIEEMRQVLKLGINPEKIIFSHPRKPIEEIVFAEKNRIKFLVFDSIEELDKMRQYAPSGKYILRIKTHDEHSATPLSSKFGTTITGAYKILDYAYKHNAPVVGVSFHVGSNNLNPTAFTQALKDASELFKYSQAKWNRLLTILDLGGGWPGNNDERFVSFANVVKRGIAQYFPKNTQVIAEPGRYFATQMITVVLRIIGTERLETSNGIKYAYYLSNGAYGFFLASIYHQYNPQKIALQGWSFHPLKLEKNHQQHYPAILWGPTCDSGDKILDNVFLPKMQMNDFVYTKNAGAYTYSLQTDFNQITPSKPYLICVLDDGKSHG